MVFPFNRNISFRFRAVSGKTKVGVLYRKQLDQHYVQHSELFPQGFEEGYRLKDSRTSKKTGIITRRIIVRQIAYTVVPSFVMPHMAGFVSDVENGLFLRKFTVPYWAIAHCYGKDAMYWWRLETGLGRHSLVGTTIKDPALLPEHIAGDEKHTRRLGDKHYCATTVADGCVLGAAVAESAGQKNLEAAYGVFQQEAQAIDPDYSPKTANVDGWAATRGALSALFPKITIIMCFLHVFIGIRDRCSKKFKETFCVCAQKLWDCYRAETKRSFSQRVRRLVQWVQNNEVPDVMKQKIEKLRANLSFFTKAYDFVGSLRTSNMIDRLMQRMDRHLFAGQYFHGTLHSAQLNIRAWALIHNFAPFNPWSVKLNDGVQCPAERLNGFRYHPNWLQNLLISTSLVGKIRPSP